MAKCEAALKPNWRRNGRPSFQACSLDACTFRYAGSSGSFTVNCAALQGGGSVSGSPTLPFFNPGLCTTGSNAQQALMAACKADKQTSELCVGLMLI